MSGDGPKLYANKPKKSQLKQSASMASSSTPAATAPPPQPPKESFARRYKFMWPLLLAVNFAVGAYLFMRTKKQDVGEEGEAPNVPSTSVSTTAAATILAEKPLTPPPIMEPPKPRDPIPGNQQRDLFKWILEEKRKVKPKDPEEKKRIDEEKALLKQFIRAKSIPNL